MPSFTTFDKAIAALIGSILSILALLGVTTPDFFNGPIMTQIISVVLPSLLPTIMVWFSKNKTT